jgi:CRISPR system Cascade subunit CasD
MTMHYLVFTLYGPMAAEGGVAVGERRTGWDRPGRSAVLGLIGAALGIDRADQARLAALDQGLGLALRCDATGRLLSDYHSIQVPPARRNRHYATRRQELADEPLETMLTRREYRTDALHLVALWQRAPDSRDLGEIGQALARPVFRPYLGRLSCPPGLPFDPQLIEAADVRAAFAVREARAKGPEQAIRRAIRATPGLIWLDRADATGQVQRIERRRDLVASRARWQFALREEAALLPGEATP